MSDDADVIIVGSGFGGAICANRLASAGLETLVLERGPWRDSLPVRSMGISRRAPFPYGAKAFTHLLRTVHWGGVTLTLNTSGLYEVFIYPGIIVLAVSAVGGGSHGWLGMLTPPQDPNYWADRHPDLGRDDLEQYYEKVLADMGADSFSRCSLAPQSITSQMPPTPGARCVPAEVQPDCAIKFPRAQHDVGALVEGADGVQRQFSSFDGDGFMGSRGGAKASVDFIYAAPVLGKGATLRDLCQVTKVVPDGTGGGTGYRVHVSDLRGGRKGGRKEVLRAKRVILAAGTMNTLRLLFVGGLEPDGLAPMPSLGRRFGGNGDLPGAWFKTSAAPPMYDSAPVIGRFKLDGLDRPFLGLWALAGVDTVPLPAALKRKLAKTTPLVGMGADTGAASARFDHGRVIIDYDQEQQPIFREIREAFHALEVQSGLKTWAMKKPITFHSWGGARLAPDADHGVVDHRGEVFGNPGLYVADASALPAAAGTPPSLAIAAWAHHVADGLVRSAA